MARKRNRVCTWFVESLDAHTNEAIAGMLGQSLEEKIQHHVLCSDGQNRDLVGDLTYRQIALLERSRATTQIDFRVWRRYSNETVARRPAEFRTSLKKSADRAREKLDDIRQRRAATSS